MSKESIIGAIDATAATIRGVQRATRHRNDWLFVRVETLEEWAKANHEENISARLEELTRLFFRKIETAPVRQGVDGTNASLLAIWCREGEPAYDPPWDGMPPWMREALPTLGEEGTITLTDPDQEPDSVQDSTDSGAIVFGATGASVAPNEPESE